MGKRGPKPKPTALRIAEGNLGKRPINTAEPTPRDALPECPEHLDDAARTEWYRVLNELQHMGLIAAADRATLAIYCQAWSDYIAAIHHIRENGPMIEAFPGDTKANPMTKQRDMAAGIVLKCAAEFGLTPSARSTLKVAKETPTSTLGEWLGGATRTG